jgi:hypothetical protein
MWNQEFQVPSLCPLYPIHLILLKETVLQLRNKFPTKNFISAQQCNVMNNYYNNTVCMEKTGNALIMSDRKATTLL